MLNNTKILVADHETGYGVETADYLRRNGAYAVTRNDNSYDILKFIREQQPDAVIISAMLSDMDAAELIEYVSARVVKLPAFIIISSFSNEKIRRYAEMNKSVYFVIRPFDNYILQEKLCEIIYSLQDRNNCCIRTMGDVENEATEIIKRLGIPAHVKGYSYVRTAILACFNDPSLLEAVTKMLYPCVADKFSTTPSRVERAIRHAIEIAWNRGNTEVFNSVFGYTVNARRGKPTNSEFIALITDNLVLKYKHTYDDGIIHGMNNILVL